MAKLDWHELFYQPGAKGVAVFLELKERIRQEFSPDFLLIDARTGITEGGGIATNVLPDVVVCLLINNRENIDGLRVVLRSIQRSSAPTAGSPIQVIPVLTRIPELSDPKAEQELCDSVTQSLTETEGDLADTLSVSDVFVLHSHPDLQIQERLLVGGQERVADVPLLRDYLKLFAHFIPREMLWPYVGEMIESAKATFFDDPDGALKELEELAAYCRHIDVCRELLKFYRIRWPKPERALACARMYCELSRDVNAQEFWDVLTRIAAELHVSKAADSEWEFIETVWRDRLPFHVEIGKKLADVHANRKRHGKAADVLLKLLRAGHVEDTVLGKCADALLKSDRTQELVEMIGEYRSSASAGRRFWAAWSKALAKPEFAYQIELTKAESDRLRTTDPLTAYAFYNSTGDTAAAEALLSDLVESAVRGGLDSLSGDMISLFQRTGRFPEFETQVFASWPKEDAKRFLDRFGRSR
ncbi:MAG: hypothetical protein EA424_01260 [Planctomycetaceae bacterium]|nr:MAG: hypothetical protein EA424_01260 [Planctomycetaceae bacterium]